MNAFNTRDGMPSGDSPSSNNKVEDCVIIHLIWKDLKLHICTGGKELSAAVFGTELISTRF